MAPKDSLRQCLADFLPSADALEQHSPPHHHRITLYTLVLMLLVALVWAALAQMDRLVMGPGRLVTPLPNLIIQPLEPGILKSLDVRVGQVVHKGQTLATLDPTFAQADASQLHSRNNTLDLQAHRLEQELGVAGASGHPDRARERSPQQGLQQQLLAERQAGFAARVRQFDETIQKLRAGQESNRQDQAALASRLQSLKELETMYAELEARQFGSRAQRLNAEEKRLEVERDYQLARNKAAELTREIAATEAEKANFTKTWRQESLTKLSETWQQRDEVVDQLQKARLRASLVALQAPEDSIVLEIGKRSIGSVLKEAEPLFTLVPLNAPLEVEAEISPQDIGELRVGDPVRIKLDAYPFQKHGTVRGTVLHISADAFARQGPTGAQSYYYLLRARLDDTRLDQLPQPTRLLPGMTLQAEVQTGKRSVLAYFLYPVLRVLDESFRER